MKQLAFFAVALSLVIYLVASPAARAEDEPPAEWIEPQTGHRVVRLSREPGSASLYFHQYALLGRRQEAGYHHAQRDFRQSTWKRETSSRSCAAACAVLVTGRKTGDVYYMRDGAV